MKKSFLLILCLAFTMFSFAQKGSWYLGGTVGYNGSTNKTDSTGKKRVVSAWEFSPEIGTFLTNHVQLGLVVGLLGSTDKYDSKKENNSLSFNPTLYVRYFFKITDNFSLFTGLYLNYSYGIDKYYHYSSDGSESTYKGTHSGPAARLGIGVAYAFSPRFTAVAQYGLGGIRSITYKDNDNKKINTVTAFDVGVNTVGTGSVFNIGLYYTFKK